MNGPIFSDRRKLRTGDFFVYRGSIVPIRLLRLTIWAGEGELMIYLDAEGKIRISDRDVLCNERIIRADIED